MYFANTSKVNDVATVINQAVTYSTRIQRKFCNRQIGGSILNRSKETCSIRNMCNKDIRVSIASVLS